MVENDLSLKFVCPLCGAASQELCHVQIGVARSESHSERWEVANDALRDSVDAAHEAHAIHLVVATRRQYS